MTTLTATHAHASSTPTLVAGAVVTVVAATLSSLFAHDWGEIAIVVPAIAVVAVLVYGFVVPRARRSGGGGTALTLGILAVLTVPVAFWSGLPLVLGAAAALLGNERRVGGGSGRAIAGLVLGALAVLAYLAIYVMEGIEGKTGFLLG